MIYRIIRKGEVRVNKKRVKPDYKLNLEDVVRVHSSSGTTGKLTVVGYTLGGALLGPIFFTPFGAPVVEPTLQAHVRNAPYRHFPLV